MVYLITVGFYSYLYNIAFNNLINLLFCQPVVNRCYNIRINILVASRTNVKKILQFNNFPRICFQHQFPSF